MGHWRLGFQMHFASQLGHKYILQLDLDSYFPAPVDIDLVAHMNEGSCKMAARNIGSNRASVNVTLGLAELTRYFLVSERYTPTQLFVEDVEPPDLSGLYSEGDGGPIGGGYRRRNLAGNFLMLSLDFWYEPLVQRFVELVMSTGGHFRHRWNEQEVHGMMWLLFLQPHELSILNFPFAHDSAYCDPPVEPV